MEILNRKAHFNYFILEEIESGIELFGSEVKSIRDGNCNIKDSYAIIRNNEVYLLNMHISHYEQGNIFNKDPLRTRKLLAHKKEIQKLIGMVKQKGVTLVPLSLYWVKNKIKLEIGIARGKKLYDKRQDIAKKDAERRIQRYL